MKKTFKRGVHPPQEKEITREKPIEPLFPPEEIYLLLRQHIGAPLRLLVGKGERIKRGEKVAESEKFISAPLHTPVSGTIKAIRWVPHPAGGGGEALIIKTEKEKKKQKWKKREVDPLSLSPEEIRKKVREAGIVGMGGACFPTAVKLTPLPEKPIDTVILNGCECEPYLTCDFRIMVEKPKECILGFLAVMRATQAKRGIVGIEDNKEEAIQRMEEVKKELKAPLEIVSLKTKYPQGGEKLLIKALLGREIPSGGLPLDVGVVVQNVGTCFAIYEALSRGKPLVERILTVTGEVKRPGNYLVPIGTPLSHILKVCGDGTPKGRKLIVGGPMMGVAQFSLEVPVTKGTTGILLFSEEKGLEEEFPCIKCARCVDHCPVGLLPTTLSQLVKNKKWEKLEDYHILDCIECGCCGYVCPSKIPLVQYIKWGKMEVQARRR